MSESSGNKSSKRPEIDKGKRELVRKMAYVPPAITTFFLASNLMAPRGSPPPPPIQPEEPMLMRLLNLLRPRR